MIVTKYCTPTACKAMAKGEFRVGTLSGFAGAEGDGGLFDDLSEGKGAFQVSDEVATGETFSLGGAHISNCTFAGNGVAIHVELRTDANAFCMSRGWYSEKVHSFIRNGSPGYRANPGYTSYIEFDLQRLRFAFYKTAEKFWGTSYRLLSNAVNYGTRGKLLTRHELLSGVTEQMTQSQLINICFTKPKLFEGEREFRFLLLHGGKIERLETAGLDMQIRRLFMDSILSVNWRN